jgi:O-antigen ligase
MTKAAVDSNLSKSKAQRLLEYVLLAVCLCVIALRTTFTEGPVAQSAAQTAGDTVYSLEMSAVLVFLFVFWLVWRLCSGKFCYRFTGLEIGLCLFVAACVISSFEASNKRAAISSSFCLIAPVLMAVLLIQLLDSHSKARFLLCVIAALGIVSTWECAEQFFISNRVMIEQYRQAPAAILGTLGIQPGTFAQMMFEHRLFSRGVHGFFTTSNSAGSFAMLGLFAVIGLVLDGYKRLNFTRTSLGWFIKRIIAAAIVVFGLAITRSKGAIIASVIAAAMLVVYFLFGKRLKAHKRIIVIFCFLFVVCSGFFVVLYGLAHERLPGGNSMLVRWQYWHSSAMMYAEHRLTGVGPGNFAVFYPHYKPAAAPEAVADPHNFLLSILTQYGPLGLAGFLALLAVPLWMVIFRSDETTLPKTARAQPQFKGPAVALLLVISLALLVIRPFVLRMPPAGEPAVAIYMFFVLYAVPVIIFILGLWLVATPLYTIRNMTLAAVLFCAVLGFLIHNLIDYAIFEPGVLTAFWAVMACLLAADSQRNHQKQFIVKPVLFTKLSAATAGAVIIWACFYYVLLPPARAAAGIKTAMSKPPLAHQLLDRCSQQDRLDPIAPGLNGRIYLQQYSETQTTESFLLEQAADCFRLAAQRNPADFKNYENLSTVYNLLAKVSGPQQESELLNKAFVYSLSAVRRYPGCGRLRVQLAQAAEQLGETDTALEQYKKAIDIEDSYRRQFVLMYPGREVFSRLGEEKYQYAKQRIEELSKQ